MYDKNFRQLLSGYYYPVTHRYGFLQAPLDDVVAEHWYWKSTNPYLRTRLDYYSKPVFFEGSLRDGLDMLNPIGYEQTLFVETKSNWTAIFESGGEVHLNYPTLNLGCQGLGITLIENTYNDLDNTGEHGFVEFNLLRGINRKSNSDGQIRHIYVAKSDDRWVFASEGAPLSFEKTENYSKKRIKDRFTYDMLIEYTGFLGLQIVDEDFYGPRMAFAGYRLKTPGKGYDKDTYQSYHQERGLKYGREY
ncbi:MAG: hypothetical protein LBP59_13460 [Planctomycetaceae bacterium]|jgi:hypothetical protein|nr:hypothetical protein [Planctomycetaceae bacterium]